MRERFVYVEVNRLPMEEPREGVCVIGVDDQGEFYLDFLFDRGTLSVDFFWDLRRLQETPEQSAVRLLLERELSWHSILELGELTPGRGALSRFYVFLAKGLRSRGQKSLVRVDFATLLSYYQTHILRSPESRDVLVKFLRP